MKKMLAACLLSAALLPACASQTMGDYMLNRGGDLVDILRVNVKAGKGIGAKVEWTRMLHGGILWEQDVWAAGLANRELTRWQESVFSWGVLLGYHDEKDVRGVRPGMNRYSGSYGWTFFQNGGNAFEAAEPNNPLDLLTFRAELMLGVGIDLEVRVGEIVDFLVGIFQFDPAGDDHVYSAMEQPS